MIRKVIILILIILLLLALLARHSFLHPGNIKIIDDIRLPVQSIIMSHMGDYRIDGFYIVAESISGQTHALSMQEMEDYLQLMQPGDIFFTYSERYVSSFFIPGKWKHAAIYLGEADQVADFFQGQGFELAEIERHYTSGHERLILDSSAEGVTIRAFTELSNLKDESLLVAITAFRINREDEDIRRFIAHSLNQLGKEYDFDLITENTSSLYCSELVYVALKHIGIELKAADRLMGRDVITPDAAVRYIAGEGWRNGEFQMVYYLAKEQGKMTDKSYDHLN